LETKKPVIYFNNAKLIVPDSLPEKYGRKNRRLVSIVIESDDFPTLFKNYKWFNFCNHFTIDRLILKQKYLSISSGHAKQIGNCRKINSVFPIVNQLEFDNRDFMFDLNKVGFPLCKTCVFDYEILLGFDVNKLPQISIKNLSMYDKTISIHNNFYYNIRLTHQSNIENAEFQYNSETFVFNKIGEKLSLIYNGNRDSIYNIQGGPIPVTELILTYSNSNLSELKIKTPNLKILKINMSVKPLSFEIVGDIQNRKVYFSQVKLEL